MFSLGIPAGTIGPPAYDLTCPNCGRSNFPPRAIAQIVAVVLIHLAVAFSLWHIYGLRAYAFALAIPLVGFLVPIFLYLVLRGLQRGDVAALFNAGCIVVGLVIVSRALGPTLFPDGLFPTVYTITTAARMPVQQVTGRPVSATITIHNSATSVDDAWLNFPNGNTASALDDLSISGADWGLQRLWISGRLIPLDSSDDYELGRLPHGATVQLKAILRPLRPGRHTFRMEVDRGSDPGYEIAVLSVATTVRGRLSSPPAHAVKMTTSMAPRQAKGSLVPLYITIRNTSHIDVADVLLDYTGAVSPDAAQYHFFDNYSWVVESMAVDGRSVDPTDYSQNSLGPLRGHHVMHVTMALIPSTAGARALHLHAYNVTADGPLLARATVRATITR
jgi:hypothetical protein